MAMVLFAAAADAGRPKQKAVPPPPPPPPPPPVVVYIPPRPTPPLGAAPTTLIPPLDTTGVRQTINAGISSNQAVWNLRSAFNVAALNCMQPEHGEILGAYKGFLKVNRVGLARANAAVNAEFQKRYGKAYIRPREAYMTRVYNYYAFPPTLVTFCDAALAIARESRTVKPAELPVFARRSIAALDVVFENFFRSFEQYRVDAAAWDAKYAPRAATASSALAAPSF